MKNIKALEEFKNNEIYGPTFEHYLDKEERRAFEHYVSMISLKGSTQEKIQDMNTLVMLVITIKEHNEKGGK